MPILFAVTILVGAVLLFSVQPLAGRLLLPMLGGSPAVWNTCLVFFQAVLLLGYLYAHWSTRLGLRRQIAIHLGVLLLPLLVLPITLDQSTLPDLDSPAWWLLRTLTIAVGLPFLVVSTTGPLMQKWFASSGHRSAHDPYFLYAASNFGSLVALLAYPLLLEPLFSLAQQSSLWRWGYMGYGICVLGCAVAILARGKSAESLTPVASNPDTAPLENRKPYRPVRWVLLSFIPSSWLMAVSTYISTDLAPIPLLWVVPLGLYLITFILAFSRIPWSLTWLSRLVSIGIVALAFVMLVGATEPLELVLPLHLIVLFMAGLLCHATLAQERPPAQELTGFYFWLSLGGVLGGVFNSLLAPVIFSKLGLVEYPLILIVLGWLRPAYDPNSARSRWDILAPVLVGLATGLLILLVNRWSLLNTEIAKLADSLALSKETLRAGFLFALPTILIYTFVDRPRRFALGLAAIFLAAWFDPGIHGRTIVLERNFLGIVRITRDEDGTFTKMVHGNTVHGQQRVGSTEPLAYYHPTGPAGNFFQTRVSQLDGTLRIGAVGLGTGALASYARPNEDWIFFELDPAVDRIARNPDCFTFLAETRAKSMQVLLGDARLQLMQQPDHSFDVLVLDAFSSDAIPIHLLTAQALEMYRTKLRPGGLLLFHVSNRYLDLPPIVGRLAERMNPPMKIRVSEDLSTTDEEKARGKFASIWLTLAEQEKDWGDLARSPRWQKLTIPPATPYWTDDRANLLKALRHSSPQD